MAYILLPLHRKKRKWKRKKYLWQRPHSAWKVPFAPVPLLARELRNLNENIAAEASRERRSMNENIAAEASRERRSAGVNTAAAKRTEARDMNENISLDLGIGPIGLCLSGGGFRAVAFHLGTLSYLDHVGLRQNIRQLSTVSGGTYIGAKYVLSLMEGVSFPDFFRSYYQYAETTDLMALGLSALQGPRPETPSGRQHLIAGMARAHAETSMKDPQGRQYLFGQILDAKLPLDEIVFNSTELRQGQVFRFQCSASGRVNIGTDDIQISRADAAQIRMADIVAASSCFPGGFEPLAFPDDFVWADRRPPAALRNQFSRDGKPAPVLLVDGCVADNPGIESILITNRDAHSSNNGLLVISDIDPYVPELYSYLPPGKDGGLSLRMLVFSAVTVMVLWLLSIAGMSAFTWTHTESVPLPLRTTLSLAPFLLGLTMVSIMLWVSLQVRSAVTGSVPEVGDTAWKHLMKTRFHQFVDMLKLRATSVLKVTNLVYPTRIRNLLYKRLDSDPLYRDNYVSNVLCELATGQTWPETMPKEVPRPSAALVRTIDAAEAVPITLWFDSPEQLPCLVAAGQADMCFNLMEWIARRYGKNASAYPANIRKLWNQLLADWQELNADPYSLIHTYLPDKQLAPAKAAQPAARKG